MVFKWPFTDKMCLLTLIWLRFEAIVSAFLFPCRGTPCLVIEHHGNTSSENR